MKKLWCALWLLAGSQALCQTIQSVPGATVTQKSTMVERIDGLERLEEKTGLKLYMEKGTEVLLALRDRKTIWRSDIFERCGPPKSGKAELNGFRLIENPTGFSLEVTYGDDCVAIVELASGKVDCKGCE